MISLTLLTLVAQCAAAATATSSNFTVAAGWYAAWHVTDVPLDSVRWSKYTHLTYAFAMPTVDPKIIALAESDQELLPKFVSAARKNNVKAGLSIGGWGGSQYFSSNLASASSRTSFVTSVTNLIKKYDLDLVDFDWEYPGVQGIGCNTISTSDTANFLSMLQELRTSPIAANITLTAATAVVPFPSANATMIAEFAAVLNWIAPMPAPRAYNARFPGAPLDDSCYASTANASGEGLSGRGSARSAVDAWVGAGMPRAQIALGVPSYGHSFDVNASAAFLPQQSSSAALVMAPYPMYDTTNHTVGDRWDSTGGTDMCGKYWGPGGVWNFRGLVAAGYLLDNGTIAPGIPYTWDVCSSTPYMYIKEHGILLSYEDPQSFAAKGSFVRANQLAGFSMWEVGGDPQAVLLDAIRPSYLPLFYPTR
ncbi:chitinase [Mycena rebaudengoi]|nr:chitinase [Mycena rebaudengoi]